MRRRDLLTLVLWISTTLLACERGHTEPQKPSPGTPSSTGQPAAAAQPASAPQPAPASAPAEPTNPGAPAQPPLGIIYLQELGTPLPKEDLDFTLRSLGYYFPNPVVVLPPRDLPEAAYYPPRSRYRAEKLLDALIEQTPKDAQVVVGLTTVDISTTKGPYEDWGILGLATVSGRECVISRFRAQRGAQNAEHTRQRLAKVVVHEIGHTLGLSHCPTFSCLMEDGKGSVLTTDHELDFCPTCRGSVGEKLLPASGPLPWDPPAQLP
jgi:archaemetzincin